MHQSPTGKFKLEFKLACKLCRNFITVFTHPIYMLPEGFLHVALQFIKCFSCYNTSDILVSRRCAIVSIPIDIYFYFPHNFYFFVAG